MNSSIVRKLAAAVMVCSLIVLSTIMTPPAVDIPFAVGKGVDTPRKQMLDGVAPEDIVCRPGLTLVLRGSGTAACVKPSNAIKLVERGWGTVPKEGSMMDDSSIGASTFPILALVDYTSHSADDAADGVAIVDLNPHSPTFGEIVQQVSLGPQVNPHHLYYNRDGSKLYTTALGGPVMQAGLFMIELEGQRIKQTQPIDTGTCKVAEDLYFTEDGTRFYMTCMGSDRVIIYDQRSFNIAGLITASRDSGEPYVRYPHGIYADEKIDRMIVTETVSPALNDAGSTVSVIELSSGKVLSTITLAKNASTPGAPVEVFFHPEHPVAYVTGMLESSLWALIWDPETQNFDPKLVDDGESRGQSWPLEMYLGPDRNLYVTWAQPGVVNVYDIEKPESPKLIKTLPADVGAHHIAFSEDGRYMFVQNNLLNLEGLNSGTISVVDLHSGELISTVKSFVEGGWQPASILLLR
jgi:DNA-binding beta-propeller fold protein YncE